MSLPRIESLDLRSDTNKHREWWAQQKRTKSIEDRARFRLGVWDRAIPTLWDHPDKAKQAIRNSGRLRRFLEARSAQSV